MMRDGDRNPVPGLNGAGTGYRPRQAAAYPGNCAPLSAGPIASIREGLRHRRVRVRTDQFCACQHGTLATAARSGAGVRLAADVTGSSGWTQRPGSHLRRGRADTDARDRRLPQADAGHKERYRRHGRENDRALTRAAAPSRPGMAVEDASGAAKGRQTGSKRLIMPDTCPGQPACRTASCLLGRGRVRTRVTSSA